MFLWVFEASSFERFIQSFSLIAFAWEACSTPNFCKHVCLYFSFVDTSWPTFVTPYFSKRCSFLRHIAQVVRGLTFQAAKLFDIGLLQVSQVNSTLHFLSTIKGRFSKSMFSKSFKERTSLNSEANLQHFSWWDSCLGLISFWQYLHFICFSPFKCFSRHCI